MSSEHHFRRQKELIAQTSTSFKNWISICVLILFLQFSFGGDRDFGLMQMCWLSHNPEKTEHLQHSFANVYIKTYSQPGAFANPLKN